MGHEIVDGKVKVRTIAIVGRRTAPVRGRAPRLRSRLLVMSLSVMTVVGVVATNAVPAVASRARADQVTATSGAAVMVATNAGASSSTAPTSCTSTVDFSGQGPIGPGSWCLLAWDYPTFPGAYKPSGKGTLGDYKVVLSSKSDSSVTIAIPGGGLFMGFGAAVCQNNAPCLGSYQYTEDVAAKERVPAGRPAIEGDSCGAKPDHASSCTITFGPASIMNPSQLPLWYISPFGYYNGKALTWGEFAIDLIYPVSSPR